jgi:hypothetical protein
MKKSKLKVHYIDLENSRMIVEFPTYSLYDNNRIEPKYIKKDWAFTCGAWASIDLQKGTIGKVNVVSVLDNPKLFKEDNRNDFVIVKKMHEVISGSDLLIGHNAATFDIAKLNYKFTKYGLPALDFPPIVDTLKAARKYYRSTSNSLYFLAKEFGVPMKAELPKGIMHAADEGDVKALKKLIAYNKQDIVSGASLYLKMLPYIKNHPDIRRIMGLINTPKESQELKSCGTCGSKHVVNNGTIVTKLGKFQRRLCMSCGSTTKGNKRS